jgi:hypothetical protein
MKKHTWLSTYLGDPGNQVASLFGLVFFFGGLVIAFRKDDKGYLLVSAFAAVLLLIIILKVKQNANDLNNGRSR